MSSKRVQAVRRYYKERMQACEVILCALCFNPIPLRPRGAQMISRGGKGGLSIDHIIEKSKGGGDARSNLQPTHVLCNNDKSNRRQRLYAKKSPI